MTDKFEELMIELSESYPVGGAPREEIEEQADELYGMSAAEVEEEVERLRRAGKLMEPTEERYMFIQRT